MKMLFWILSILALAVALTMAARFNTGYVLLVLPPYRVELSLNLMIALVLAAFFLGYGLIRLGVGTLNLSSEMRAFKQKRREEKARSAMRNGLAEFAAGHYSKAETLAVSAFEQGVDPEINALVAARCAHALGAHERRDAHLARVGKTCSDYPDAGMVG